MDNDPASQVQRLADALRTAYSKITSYESQIQVLLGKIAPPQGPPVYAEIPDIISGRELEILTLLSDGATKREVADRLGLSEDTVKTHMQRLRDRWDARSTAQLVAIAKDAWLTPPRSARTQ